MGRWEGWKWKDGTGEYGKMRGAEMGRREWWICKDERG